jgi:hypothetical protein
MIFLGLIFVAVGIVKAATDGADPNAEPPLAFWIVAIAAGTAGMIGGGAAFQGNRAWSRVGYLFAIPLLLAIPVGTFLGILWMMNRSRHLAAAEQLRLAG